MQSDIDQYLQENSKKITFSFLNQAGCIPRKAETRQQFFERSGREFRVRVGEKRSTFVHEEIDIDAHSLPWFVSKRGLRPWHWGVFETDGIKARIQIHPRAIKYKKLGEVLSHEAVHYLRREFDTPYEELLGYITSRKWLYRKLGFFLTSMEFKVVNIFILLGALFQFWIPWLPFLGLFLFIPGFVFCRFRCRAPLHLLQMLRGLSIKNPIALLLRLSGEEIDLLAGLEQTDLLTTMQQWKNDSFRWEFLNELYLTISTETENSADQDSI